MNSETNNPGPRRPRGRNANLCCACLIWALTRRSPVSLPVIYTYSGRTRRQRRVSVAEAIIHRGVAQLPVRRRRNRRGHARRHA